MKRQGTAIFFILLVSTGAAVAANLVREKPLGWVWRPVLVPVQPEAPEMATNTTTAPVSAVAEQVAQSAEKKPGVVTMPEVLKYLREGGAYFIDAREEHELKDGMLRGAIHLPSTAIYENISRVMSTVPPESTVIVYCGGGDCEASKNVRDALVGSFNYPHVWVYEKGWAEITVTPAFKEFVVAGGKP